MNETQRTRPVFGRLLRHWRGVRGLSQLALAGDVETITRHLSHIENGRSRPGRDLVLRLAEALVRTIGMTMRFGPSREVTLEELTVTS